MTHAAAAPRPERRFSARIRPRRPRRRLSPQPGSAGGRSTTGYFRSESQNKQEHVDGMENQHNRLGSSLVTSPREQRGTERGDGETEADDIPQAGGAGRATTRADATAAGPPGRLRREPSPSWRCPGRFAQPRRRNRVTPRVHLTPLRMAVLGSALNESAAGKVTTEEWRNLARRAYEQLSEPDAKVLKNTKNRLGSQQARNRQKCSFFKTGLSCNAAAGASSAVLWV